MNRFIASQKAKQQKEVKRRLEIVNRQLNAKFEKAKVKLGRLLEAEKAKEQVQNAGLSTSSAASPAQITALQNISFQLDQIQQTLNQLPASSRKARQNSSNPDNRAVLQEAKSGSESYSRKSRTGRKRRAETGEPCQEDEESF